MTVLMSDDEIIRQINDYSNHNYIWIEIWDISPCEIQLVITVNNERFCKFQHKVLKIASLYTDEETVDSIKERGREVKKLLKKIFKNSEIHSNLHYR